MDFVTKYMLVPVITASLTTLFLIWKDYWFEKKRYLRDVNEKQLTTLYNKIYIIDCRYRPQLFYSSHYQYEDEDGYSYPKDTKIWSEVVEELSKIINDNVHLLEHEDFLEWQKVMKGDQTEAFSEEVHPPKYEAIRAFLDSYKETHKRLYNRYHQTEK